MPHDLDRFADPVHLVPFVVMGVLLYLVIRPTVEEIGLFAEGTGTLATLCIVALALYGFDRATVGMIIAQYAAMGVAILAALASLIHRRTTKRLSDD